MEAVKIKNRGHVRWKNEGFKRARGGLLPCQKCRGLSWRPGAVLGPGWGSGGLCWGAGPLAEDIGSGFGLGFWNGGFGSGFGGVNSYPSLMIEGDTECLLFVRG